MPMLRPPVPTTECGIEISRIRTKTVASAPSATTISGSGAAAGNSSPNRRRSGEADDGDADQEDELAERAAVPAGHRQRRPFDGLARVPARERGDGEHEAADPGQPPLPSARIAGPRAQADVAKLRAAARPPALRLRRLHGSDAEDCSAPAGGSARTITADRQQQATEHEPEADACPAALAPALDRAPRAERGGSGRPARSSADRAAEARRAGSESVPARPRGKV